MTASSLSNVNDNHNDDIVDYYDIHNGNGDNRDRNECLRVLRAGFSTRVSYEWFHGIVRPHIHMHRSAFYRSLRTHDHEMMADGPFDHSLPDLQRL